MSEKTDYEKEVKKVMPKAKVYHTGDILGGACKVYHAGIKEENVINIITPSHLFAGNKQKAWEFTYDYLKQQGKIL